MKNIDAKKLKRELTADNIKTIVHLLSGQVYHENNKEIIFYSCCHHLFPLEHKPKLYFYKETQMFKCYTCSSSFDIISLVETRWQLEKKQFSFTDILNFIAEIAGIAEEKLKRYTNISKTEMPWEDILGKYTRIKKGESTLQEYSKSILNFFSSCVPYDWIQEGISVSTMQLYGIKFYPFRNQTVIPCFNENNKLIGIRVRNWQPEENRKYDSLKLLDDTDYKFSTNQVLYGFNFNKYAIEQRKEIWIVESEKAVMKADTWFGEHSLVVGLFGVGGWNLNQKRRDMILKTGVNKVVIFPDYDYTEIMSTEYFQFCKRQIQLAEKFRGFCEVEIVINFNDMVKPKDNAFDVEKEDFDRLWNGKVDKDRFIKQMNQDKDLFERGVKY